PQPRLPRSPDVNRIINWRDEMFSSMKVGTRLAIAFGVVVILLGAIIAVGVGRMAAINEGLRVVAEENNLKMKHAVDMRGSIYASSLTVRNMMLYTDAQKVATENQAVKKSMEKFET